MTTYPGDLPGPQQRPRQAVRPARLAWLGTELERWQTEGLVAPDAARDILAHYAPSRRFSLANLIVVLGACLLGVGLIWLVAANLDQLSPGVRLATVAAFWLGFTAGAEALAVHRDRHPGSAPAAVVGAARLLTALAFGAVVFQAAQSLQVPAYSSGLVGVWGAGALIYAYAVTGVMPLLVGIVTTTVWYVWTVTESAETWADGTLSLLLAGAAASAVAVAHAARWLPRFAAPWREVGALLALVGLFVAALPYTAGELAVSTPLIAGAVGVLLLAATAAALADRTGRLEVLVAVATVVVAALLLVWDPAASGTDDLLTGEGLLRAVLSTMVFLAAAGWYATLGTLRDTPRLTFVAIAGIVVFTTTQSFAVFAPILSGATLFLVVGAVLVGTGYAVHRGRRRLVADMSGATS